ncbi:MAG: exodeoxyribonuclease VII large subunit, partial [Candidatus Omnitrophica bacterium]|nr:exodeoxyribonuclease VII large subunit [Candidatus Omnitrophota bacterium]
MDNGRHIFSVTEITQGIKQLLGGSFSSVWVEGEISNFRPSSAGHWYFSLKDDGAVLSAVIFSRASKEVPFKPEDGLKVICFGSIDVYPPRGSYQLIIERIEPKGIGSLQLALEQLKIKLEKEGLFAPEHKKEIPYLPASIGVVTSITGAAIKDILKVLDRRFKDVHIIIAGVKVQGDGAKEEIAQAIEDFNAYNDAAGKDDRIDVLIVGRGGGSIEDLWAFNEEIVARAIYASRIPVISAVGHERDVTISDLVADRRAATPSVAAEIVIPRQEDLKSRLEEARTRLKNAFSDEIAQAAGQCEESLRLLKLGMAHIWELNRQRLDALAQKLVRTNPSLVIPEYSKKMQDLARQMAVR